MNVAAAAPEKTAFGDCEDRRERWEAEAVAVEGHDAGPAAERDNARTFELEALPHLDTVYRVALRLARDPTQAEDLVQQTMLKAFRAWDQYKLGTNVRAWLLTILRNEAFMVSRRRQRARKTLETRDIEGITDLEDGQIPDPEDWFFDRHIAEQVLRAIDSLPVEFREAIVLRHVEDLSYAEISQITGVRVGTIKSRLFRGRALLKRQLRDYAVEMKYVSAEAGGAGT